MSAKVKFQVERQFAEKDAKGCFRQPLSFGRQNRTAAASLRLSFAPAWWSAAHGRDRLFPKLADSCRWSTHAITPKDCCRARPRTRSRGQKRSPVGGSFVNVNLTCGPRETTRLVRALLPESFVAEDAFVLLRRILDIWTSTALDRSGGAHCWRRRCHETR